MHRAPPAPTAGGVLAEDHEHPDYRYFGVYEQDVLVASCCLNLIANLTRGCRPYGLIENVVSHAAHRRRGYGQALLARALDNAWAEGCYKVMPMTSSLDPATLRFYRAAGFDQDAKQAFIARPPT
ncbi:GNAT family N-acetyltransferase [Pseudomonas sp.]|uniref:GNAT family N-acetyltransferase n=1 Tax=Pseudomonas sp. TaxID=306 RepID=UPI00299DDEA4|nr:GNAT family N-acetyltransferase [Pseudomonas sp.]MDX1366278.1 GNAT family N-acetyltransferase [Pseudomonas sp.]